MEALFEHWQWVLLISVIVGLALAYQKVLWLFGVIVVPDDSVGVVTKKFVLFGEHKDLPHGRIVALNGEAGYQADALPPGLHWALWPWQFDVEMVPFTVIPEGMVGFVQASDGSPLVGGRIVGRKVSCDSFQDARAFLQNDGERGPQVALIPPGTYRINPRLFKVETKSVVHIEPGKIGIIEALDGKPMPNGRVIASGVECDSFQDGHAFLSGGGERGPQMKVITPGTYRINPVLFNVTQAAAVDVPENQVGIVTTKDGSALEHGEIAGAIVEGHDLFQDAHAFLSKGGTKGLQEQVLMAGRYFINPKFATVEIRDIIEVPIAHVGVVISFVGEEGEDVTGQGFKHANMVARGKRGVWIDPLDPGKYPFNPYTHRVINVPTANVVLNWASGKSEAHKLDEKLSTIAVRSADGFSFNLDVSQIIHIPRSDAPKVIARFGGMEALVTQVLEPTIGNYFRNAAQGSDIIDFLTHRSVRQTESRESILNALEEYNVCAVDTLIGDIVPPPELMKTLTDRKIAAEELKTYENQRAAEVARQQLEQARALANTQAKVVDAERKVSIAEYDAKSAIATAKGTSEAKTIQAEADATVLGLVGNAEAGKIQAIGEAEACVIKSKIESMDSDNYALVQIAQAFATSGIKLVPDVVASGGGGQGGTIVDVLLGTLLRDSMQRSGALTHPSGT